MELENFLYAGVQIAHNFGAAAVVGLPIAALRFRPAESTLRRMAWLTLLAWLVQAASGAGFGTVSFFEEGELPQIHHLALAALSLKIFCAAVAVTLLAIHFLRRGALGPGVAAWRGLVVLGVTALTSAAVLRWFS
ncbi:MAG TPA: hypothetical protein VLZ74_00080 [Methylocella sp.]|nr:hypothetical protein [Methylocella sp.]